MLEGSRERRDEGDRAYYALPAIDWGDLDPAILAEIRNLTSAVLLSIPATEDAAPVASAKPITPVAASLRLYEIANRIWTTAAGEEADLRQVITTLRTALTVCLDLYPMDRAQNVSVYELMGNLREQIEDFEAELGASGKAED